METAPLVHPAQEEIVLYLERVKLVRKADGKHELVGGTVKAQAKVRYWCAVYAFFLEFVGEAEEGVVGGKLSWNGRGNG